MMVRVLVAIALLALTLLVATGLLVQRSVQSLAVEEASRHRAVAERVFDEMERALSGFLEAEEERPVGHYHFRYRPDGSQGLVRSPLSLPGAAEEPSFVVGYFRIEPDGSLGSPLQPGDGSAPATDAERVDRVFSAVRPWLGAAGARDDAPSLSQAPGTTVTLSAGKAEAGDELDLALEERESDAYDAFRSLNRAGDARREREPKVLAKQRPAAVEEGLASSLRSLGYLADAAPEEAAPPSAAPAAPPGRLRRQEPLRIVVDPLIGRRVGGFLLLVRTVLVGEGGYRQGLVVEPEALGRWLRSESLGPSLAGAMLDFTPPDPPPAAPGSYVFQHRFAEPFDAVGVRLVLPPLPGSRGAAPLYGLAGLLLVTAAGGLFALYRMVAVRVRFAERRSNFVAAVSHELKSPLTAIRMYGEMLRDGVVTSEDKRREYYETITAESERLSRLINNVLEFRRLESGGPEVSLEVGELGPVVEEVAEILRPHAEREGFGFEVEVEEGLPAVRFDRDSLSQVLFNLVDNALKYAADEGPRLVTISCRRAGSGVELRVRDRGPGIPADHLRQVFEPFYRAESELTRTSRGTGLGLALVKGLVERMDAHLESGNADGGGFEVRIGFEGCAGAPA